MIDFDMVEKFNVQYSCKKTTPCKHACIIHLKDGRFFSGTLGADNLLKLINEVASDKFFKVSPLDYTKETLDLHLRWDAPYLYKSESLDSKPNAKEFLNKLFKN